MRAIPHLACPALVRALVVLVLSLVLPASAAAASTLVVFSASEFVIDSMPAEGLISGTLEAEDLNGDGTITAAEVQAFSFVSEFAGTVLDGAGDLTSHTVFDLPGVTGPSLVLAPGLETRGLGFIDTGGFPGLAGGLGSFSLLTLANGVLGFAQGEPLGISGASLISAVSTDLVFVSQTPLPVPLPGAAGLLLIAVAGLAIWRRQRV